MLATDWTKGVKDKHDLEQTIRGSTVALGRLKEIAEGYLNELNRTETSMDNYNNPSWSHKQAHINGRKQELIRLLNLLSFLDNKE